MYKPSPFGYNLALFAMIQHFKSVYLIEDKYDLFVTFIEEEAYPFH
jgi:hypothetical protein